MAKRKCIPAEILERIKEEFEDDEEVLEALENIKPCRGRSKYQDFVSKCMKGGGTIPSCAKEWKKFKEKQA